MREEILTAAAERVGRRAVVALWRKDFASMAVCRDVERGRVGSGEE
jgi:hypothetical protein